MNEYLIDIVWMQWELKFLAATARKTSGHLSMLVFLVLRKIE